MSGTPEFSINASVYEWCVRGFSLLRKRLGMNMAVHADPGVIAAGEIFQFNHFTRFETIIPQYFIHQATGAYCRCVADYRLFEGNERLAKLLWNVGAVPSNHPGLLPFLAAEILRGRKVIIFPEGSMIKDRQIATAPSSAFLPSQGPPSRHRQGAAALAVVLEIFKKRILSVHEAGDTERIGRWVKALGLTDQNALIAAASRPTMIVPSNITFHPIHTGDNILRKAAEFFHVDLGERGKEELLVEGNFLFKQTDMDIRFGKPFHPDVAWNIADRMMLRRVFENIESLDDLFSLKTSASRWIERMAAVTLGRTTRRLRDLCMAEMYARVTVNLNHLASRIFVRLMEAGEKEIPKDRFHETLYAIVKQAQRLPGIHLHWSLEDPEAYDGLHDGSNPRLIQFLHTVSRSGLIEITPSHYKLLPALQGGDGRRDPRLENVVRVYANEIGLLKSVLSIVARGMPLKGQDLAWQLFDDELRAHAKSRQRFTEPRHAAVNSQETATESAEPYLIIPDAPQRPGVVLVHGFLASPAELKSLGDTLVSLGHPVLGVRLKGHGTSPWDLKDRSWEDWLASVKRGYEIMSHVTPEVLLIGFATGASLALHHAASRPRGLSGVVAVSAPLKFSSNSLALAPVMHGFNKLSTWVYSEEGIKPFQLGTPEHPHIDYRHVPVRGLVELRRAAEELGRCLPQVTCPVTVIHASDDPIADPASARAIHDAIGSSEKSLHIVSSNRHGILHQNLANTHALVLSIVNKWAPLPQAQVAKRQPVSTVLAATLNNAATQLMRRFGRTARETTSL